MASARAARPRLDGERLRAFQTRILRWFRKNGRDLPWRRTRDPYKILVSEVMLQQTQVERVRDYYARFLREYPTVRDLAAAHPGRVRGIAAIGTGILNKEAFAELLTGQMPMISARSTSAQPP